MTRSRWSSAREPRSTRIRSASRACTSAQRARRPAPARTACAGTTRPGPRCGAWGSSLPPPRLRPRPTRPWSPGRVGRMGIGCFVSVGRSLQEAIERAKLAEELGYESVYVTHVNGPDALTVLAAYACATQRVRLGTGVVPIYTRTPATMAQTAATLHALSGGRLNLGLGVSHRPVVEGWHGQSIDKPVAEMKEYVGKVRAILSGEQL